MRSLDRGSSNSETHFGVAICQDDIVSFTTFVDKHALKMAEDICPTAPAHTKKSVTTGIIPSDGVRR